MTIDTLVHHELQLLVSGCDDGLEEITACTKREMGNRAWSTVGHIEGYMGGNEVITALPAEVHHIKHQVQEATSRIPTFLTVSNGPAFLERAKELRGVVQGRGGERCRSSRPT